MNTEPRTQRCGNSSVFMRRYNPSKIEFHGDVNDLPANQDIRLLWTLISKDGWVYICAGKRLANYLGYILATVPWDDQEEFNTPYRW